MIGGAAPEPAAPAPVGTPTPAVWEEVKRLSGSTRRLKAIVDDLQLLSLAEATAVVKAGTLAALARTAQKEIEEIFGRATGRKIALTIQNPDAARPAPGATSPDPTAAPDQHPSPSPPPIDPREHPLVKQAQELLGARVVRIEQRQRPA